MDFTLFLTLFVFALLSNQTIDGFTVELIHPNSPSNPYRNPSNNRFDWIRQMHNSRAATIQSRLGVDGSSKFKTNIIKPLGGGYVMKYSIGTPPFETYGLVDTSSDVTWTQCKLCIDCFPQSSPIFDPKHSKSYKTVVCNGSDTTCSLSDYFECSSDNVCQYDLSSETIGDVATDTLTIGETSFKNVVLGCGHQNKFKFPNGTASGILGLGYSNVSIIKQLRKEIGGKFAHCLSPQSDSKSYISFGTDAIVKGPDTVLISFVISPEQPFYYWLILKSMSVGDKNFPVQQSPEEPVEANGNIIIDSGSTVTSIPSDVFDGMKSELIKHIPGTPIDDPQGFFRLCYSTTTTKSVKIKVPKIVAHFTGGDVELSPRGLFEEVEEGISCLTIVPSNMMATSIFGYQSQVDYLVGFDLESFAVTFKPAVDCSKILSISI